MLTDGVHQVGVIERLRDQGRGVELIPLFLRVRDPVRSTTGVVARFGAHPSTSKTIASTVPTSNTVPIVKCDRSMPSTVPEGCRTILSCT
jgi:hypothetical protein